MGSAKKGDGEDRGNGRGEERWAALVSDVVVRFG